MPSSGPSLYPTTSVPTLDGETNSPSRYPTSAPSYDLNYQEHPSYVNFVSNMDEFTAKENSYTFGSYFFKGITPEGTCSDWDSYVGDSLLLPFDDVYFSTITAVFESYNYGTQASESITATCSDRVMIPRLVSSLLSELTFEGNCDGKTWRMFMCSGNRVFCINCKRKCVPTESCPGTAAVVNPCASCSTHAAASVIFHAEYSEIIYYPLIEQLNVTARRTSVEVGVEVSNRGTVYCAAFLEGTILTSSLQIKARGASKMFSSTGVISVLLVNLNPDTTYDVYCYTSDFSGHLMPIRVAEKTSTTVRTSCCRSIVVSTAHPNIVQYGAASNRPEKVFQFELDSPPTSLTTMNLKLSLVSCSSFETISDTPSARILPSVFSFNTNSSSLTASFVVRGTIIGCYLVSASTEGQDFYTANNVSFVLQNFRIPPDAPTLKRAWFSDSLTSLVLSFDSATDRASSSVASYANSFSCAQLVSFPSSAAAVCKWRNSTVLVAHLPSSGLLPSVGDDVTLFGSKVKALCVADTDCGIYEYTEETTLELTGPTNPLVPTVLLFAPKLIAACDNMTIDPTASSGFGGRPWSSVLWSVSANGIAERAEEIATYLNENFQDTFEIASVPNGLLTPSAVDRTSSYSISLQLTNFLKQTFVRSVTVEVDHGVRATVPQIRLYGTELLTFRSRPITLYAAAQVPICAGSNASLPLLYKWRIYSGRTFQSLIQSASLNKRYLKLPAFTLQENTVYTVSVEVSLPTTSGVNPTRVTVTNTLEVGRAGVVAQLAGGSKRSIVTSESITFDASSSYDVDYPSSSALVFRWSCIDTDANYGSSCPGFVSVNEPQLTLLASSLTASEYLLGVTVTNSVGSSDSTTVELTVFGNTIPVVSLNAVKTKYNPAEKIVLTGSITAELDSVVATWTSPSITRFSSSGIASTPLSKATTIGSSLFQLALRGDTLTAGLTYTFQLDVHYQTTASSVGTASVDVVMNEAPSSGVLTVSPSEGTAASTEFWMVTSEWTDDDVPISFVFSYHTLNQLDSNVVKFTDEVPYVLSVLGSGLREQFYTLTCVVAASDLYGAAASTSVPVTVYPGNVEDVVQLTRLSLEVGLVHEDPRSIAQSIDAALAVLNSVNCDVSTECGSINREICSTTARTCGPCLSGFVGPSGHSNIPCNSTSVMRRIGDSCAVNSSCITGLCVAGLCSDVEKSCPSDCSGQGTCVRVDTRGSIVNNCFSSDDTCLAQCECDSGSFGKDCSMTQYRFEQYLDLREALCSSLYSSITFQDLSLDVVVSRAKTIRDVFFDINQMTDTAISNCTSALIETINSEPDLVCQGDAVVLIVDALSQVLQLGGEISDQLISEVEVAVSDLSESCHGELAVGEKPLQVLSDNLRLLVSVVEVEAASNRTLQVPQTDFELFNGRSPSSVQVNGSGASDAKTVGISVYQLPSLPQSYAGNSSSILLETMLYDSIPDVTTRRLQTSSSNLDVTVVLQNTDPINFGLLDPSVIVLKCFRDYRPTPYYLNATCPNGLELNLTCPANSKGIYNITCPGYTTIPHCTTWDGTDFSIDGDCSVLNYTAENTTCLCTDGERSSRRAQEGQTVVTKEYSSTLTVTNTRFSQSFTLAPPALIQETNIVILATLLCVLGVMLYGVVCTVVKRISVGSQVFHAEKYVTTEVTATVRSIKDFYTAILPEEFRLIPWHRKLWGQVKTRHSWNCLLQTDQLSRWQWALQVVGLGGRLLVYVTFNTLLTLVLYADDGSCESFNEESCEEEESVGGWKQSCQWRVDNETCEFLRPTVDFVNIAVLVFFLLLLSSPLVEFITYLVTQIQTYLTRLQRPDLVVELPMEADEFRKVQGRKATIMRAARLEKARKCMDFVVPYEEALLLLRQTQMEVVRRQNLANSFGGVVDLAQYKNIADLKENNLTKRLSVARSSAAEMYHNMANRSSTFDNEQFLMRQFISNQFSGCRRALVEKHLLANYRADRSTAWTNFQEYSSFLLLPVFYVVMIYLVVSWWLIIGSRATDLWLTVFAFALLGDAVLVQPLSLWMTSQLVNSCVSGELRNLCAHLERRTPLILRRRFGLMRDATALIQHFNPACRAARLFPALPVSRLLMSVGDTDMLRQRPKSVLERLSWYSRLLLLTMLVYFPNFAQEVILYSIAVTTLTVVLLGIYALGRLNFVAAACLVGLIVLLCVSYSVYLMKRKDLQQREEERRANKSMFQVVDDEDEEFFAEEKQKSEKQKSVTGSPLRNISSQSVVPIGFESWFLQEENQYSESPVGDTHSYKSERSYKSSLSRTMNSNEHLVYPAEMLIAQSPGTGFHLDLTPSPEDLALHRTTRDFQQLSFAPGGSPSHSVGNSRSGTRFMQRRSFRWDEDESEVNDTPQPLVPRARTDGGLFFGRMNEPLALTDAASVGSFSTVRPHPQANNFVQSVSTRNSRVASDEWTTGMLSRASQSQKYYATQYGPSDEVSVGSHLTSGTERHRSRRSIERRRRMSETSSTGPGMNLVEDKSEEKFPRGLLHQAQHSSPSSVGTRSSERQSVGSRRRSQRKRDLRAEDLGPGSPSLGALEEKPGFPMLY